MWILLDHISASMIGLAVLLILGASYIGSQESAVEQTIFYASKTQTLSFASVLEEDLRQIGAGVPDSLRIEKVSAPRVARGASSEGDEEPSTYEVNVTDTLSFWRADSLGNPVLITYRLASTDTMDTAGGRIPMHRVVRFENGTRSGASPGSILAFRIDLLDASGGIVGTNPAAAKLVRVSFVNAMPVKARGEYFLRQTHWGYTVRPQNLAT